MENNNIEEFEDALSLCDYTLYDQEITDHDQPNNTPNSPSSQEDFFEFSTSSSTSSESNNIIFCGKIISCRAEDADDNDDEQKYYNPLLLHSSPSPQLLKKNNISSKNLSSNKPALPPQAWGNSSKKPKVIIGLAKIPSKMELRDLRERQNRKQQTPPPLIPAVVSGEELAVSGKGSSGRSHNWGLLKLCRFRAQDIASMATKSSSLGCLRLARPLH